jgi:hypothetical protein
MAVTGPTSATVAAGSSADYSITVTPLYGVYPGPISFSLAGLPAGAIASFAPATIAVNGGAQTVQITIQTMTTAALPSQSPAGRFGPLALALLLFPLIGVRRLRQSGRRLNRYLSMLLLLCGIAGAAALSGCGGVAFIRQPLNYNLTITATGGGVTHTVPVKLNIQ